MAAAGSYGVEATSSGVEVERVERVVRESARSMVGAEATVLADAAALFVRKFAHKHD